MAAKKKAAKKTASKARGKKSTAKKKTTAKRKSTAKKATRKKATRKKAAPKRKAAKKKSTARKSKRISIDRISGSARKLMLANLGLYGKVIDELEAQAERARDAIERARREAPDVNKDLVRRGEVVVKDIRAILKRADMPTPPKLDQQIERLRKSIENLRKRLR
ncbi:MAG: hypothetical protein KJP25_11315 [Gammaproteobacteria bacterium]|nr:hypothetical protein [Gammaproteobacteria bacterium]MBT8151172.1 hypothetical protein [Gammaproteobacteria bacterium]